jgi:glutaminyl-tRNA synthetase
MSLTDRHNVVPEPAVETASAPGQNFIRAIVEEDLKRGAYGGRVVTRFPPEPNGYLHIGHAKSIVLNFGLATDYNGACNLRMDDTNPETEDMEYVRAILDGVRWLGYDWDDRMYYASDYFEQLYRYAERLIEDGKAYVDSQTEEEIRAGRGTVTEPGRESPFRNRSAAENLDLFRLMRAGEFPDGAHVLRAKGDMASPNMKMRDPLLYRIRHAHHYRSGDDWCIYPMYDYAHPLSDAIEGITHSLCTLEFDNNREIYDWVLDNLVPEPRPHQYEFARLNLDYTVLSKRKLLELVKGNYVNGWDDPRMPTLAGLRRRGITPEAIRDFCERIGVAKVNSRVDIAMLEHSIRNDLNYRAPRVLCVLRPLKVIITNYSEEQEEWLDAPYWPHDVPREGSRRVPFSRELYIEQDDFLENPPRKFHRLSPGAEVRLRYGYLIKCTDVIKDAGGRVTELRCTYDPATKGGETPDGRKVKGTIHWVSARHALPCEVRLYDRLFTVPDPDEREGDFTAYLNPESLVTLTGCLVEPSVAEDPADTRYQFERQGYFWRDPADSKPEGLAFNRIVSLRDSWAKIAGGDGGLGERERGGESERERGRKGERGKEGEVGSAFREASTSSSHTPTPPHPQPDPLERLSEDEKAAVLRYTRDLNLQLDHALILAGSPGLARFFEEAVAVHNNAPSVANWIVNVLRTELKDRPVDQLPFTGTQMGALVALADGGTITGRIAKDVLGEMLQHGGDPQGIIQAKGWQQVSDPGALTPVVDKVLAALPDKAEQYRSGKTGLMGLFVGQVMRETGGKANPELVRQILLDRLEKT